MQINQVIWVINSENQSVVPVKVVEKIIKETASGVKTEFIVETVGGKKSSLASTSGPYFEDIQEATSYLLNVATELINKVINRAAEAAKKFQSETSAPQVVQSEAPDGTMYQEETELVTLPDGRQAKVRIRLPEVM